MQRVAVEAALHLGKSLGDIVNTCVSRLRLPVDLLICGPPCPPWAGQGTHKGQKDPKAKVFKAIILWIIYLAAKGGLLIVIIENVPGIRTNYNGHESAACKFIRVLRSCIPCFCWRVDTLKLVDYMSPQTRVRTFIRGMRTTICGTVPAPLPAWGAVKLKDCLGNFQHTPRSNFTAQQQVNIRVYEQKIVKMVEQGVLSRDDLVCIAPDRQDGLTYSQQTRKMSFPLSRQLIWM